MSRYEHDDDIMEDDEAAPDEMRNYGDYLHDDWDDLEVKCTDEEFEHEQFDDDDRDDRDEFEMNDDGDFDMDDDDTPF